MLVGNKCDLAEKHPNMRKINRDDASKFAKIEGILFEETSALL